MTRFTDRIRLSADQLLVFVWVTGVVAVVALVIAVVGLKASVDQATQRAADLASRQATKAALCDFYAYQLGAGLPPPTTDRGRSQVVRARDAFDRLECKEIP